MNKKYLLQAILLIGFIAINIFPTGCFSWGGSVQTKVPTPLALPSDPVDIQSPTSSPIGTPSPTTVTSTPSALPSPSTTPH